MKKKSAKKNSPTRKPKTTNRVKYQFPLWLAAAVVILVGVIAYWNSFDAPLVFDDFLTIQNNDFVRFGDVLSFKPLGARSLLYMTFGINYALHEQDVWGYHLVNVTLHLLNGLLILLIALYTFRRIEIEESKARIYAVLAGAFFVWSPDSDTGGDVCLQPIRDSLHVLLSACTIRLRSGAESPDWLRAEPGCGRDYVRGSAV